MRTTLPYGLSQLQHTVSHSRTTRTSKDCYRQFLSVHSGFMIAQNTRRCFVEINLGSVIVGGLYWDFPVQLAQWIGRFCLKRTVRTDAGHRVSTFACRDESREASCLRVVEVFPNTNPSCTMGWVHCSQHIRCMRASSLQKLGLHSTCEIS
jgi:hypothetical protein